MQSKSPITILSTILTLPALLNAITFDCSDVLIDGVDFDISALSGPHSVFEIIQTTPTTVKNTTFTLDVCNQLGKSKDKAAEECPNGSLSEQYTSTSIACSELTPSTVCALERHYHNSTVGEPSPDDFWPIAGEFLHDGRPLDPKITLLRDSDSHADADKEGFRLELNGGMHSAIKVKQRALVEFVCDHTKTGLEGLGGEGKQEKSEAVVGKRADGDEEKPSDGRSLQLLSYKQEAMSGKGSDEIGTLRLQWSTKYACEDQKDKKPSDDDDDKTPSDGNGDKKKSSSGWGFFTWFIIMCALPFSPSNPLSHPHNNLTHSQSIPPNIRLLNLRLLAKLLSPRRSRLGSPASRRCFTRYTVPRKRLGPQSFQHGAGEWKRGWGKGL